MFLLDYSDKCHTILTHNLLYKIKHVEYKKHTFLICISQNVNNRNTCTHGYLQHLQMPYIVFAFWMTKKAL